MNSRHGGWPLVPPASCTSLHAAPASIAALAATVPPPDSRLGRQLRRRRRNHPAAAAGSSTRSPTLRRRLLLLSGTEADLGYAAGHHHHEVEGPAPPPSPSCEEPASGRNPLSSEEAVGGDGESSSSALEERPSQEPSVVAAANGQGNHTDHTHRSSAAWQGTCGDSRKGKRARMLRFLDRRFARLRFNATTSQQQRHDGQQPSQSCIDERRRHEYERRKAAWAEKYTSVSTLRKSFGKNKNRIWGDFDPTTTRRLYHTLLPRALLELGGLRDGLLASDDNDAKDRRKEDGGGKRVRGRSKVGPDDDRDVVSNVNLHRQSNEDSEYLQQELKELAPLAYRARLAAKKYARERSRLPGRIGSMLYDGYRSWRRYGRWKSSGMTWEQVWNKYEDQVLREAMEELEVGGGGGEEADVFLGRKNSNDRTTTGTTRDEFLDDEELTARICLRILERSVVTNDAIDRLFLERLADKDDDIEGGAVAASSAAETVESTKDPMREESRTRQRRRRARERQARRKLQIRADLRSIEKKFDDDIRELLRYGNFASREGEERRSRRRRGVFFWNKPIGDDGVNVGQPFDDDNSANEIDESKNLEKTAAFSRVGSSGAMADSSATPSTGSSTDASGAPTESDVAAAMFSMSEDRRASDDEGDNSKMRKLAVHEVFALRILATTKQRITSLQAMSQLGGGGGEASNVATAETELSDSEEEGAMMVDEKDGQ